MRGWVACFGLGMMAMAAAGADENLGWDEATAQAVSAAVKEKAVVNAGNLLRIQRAMAKARRGEPVVVGVIGGSITAGAAATSEENRWANRMADWWKRSFPNASIQLINAGIGATASDLGAHRVEKDLLSKNPDFVVVEYAVNDGGNPFRTETLEGLVRQILSWPTQPGCMLLYTMNEAGENTQEDHEKVARHYGLPSVSFRDALWPEVKAGRIAWKDIEADAVHPNDRGHALCADCVEVVLDKALADLPEGDLPATGALPAPLTGDIFQHTRTYTSDGAAPLRQTGWQAQPGHWKIGPGWSANEPGSELELEVEGTCVALAYYHVRGDVGMAEARVDDGASVVLDAYFPEDWGGGYTPFKVIARDLAPGKHVLRVRLLDRTHPDSKGHAFNIDAVCVAGVTAP